MTNAEMIGNWIGALIVTIAITLIFYYLSHAAAIFIFAYILLANVGYIKLLLERGSLNKRKQ